MSSKWRRFEVLLPLQFNKAFDETIQRPLAIKA
jgi:hypothetical protein